MKTLITISICVLLATPTHAQSIGESAQRAVEIVCTDANPCLIRTSSFGLWQPQTHVGMLTSRKARLIAEIASWATMIIPIVYDTKESWECETRLDCFSAQGLRLGASAFGTFAAKNTWPKARPCAPYCGIDRPYMSFWSGHSTAAFTSLGEDNIPITASSAVATAWLRVAAGKHDVVDVGVGSLYGLGLWNMRWR